MTDAFRSTRGAARRPLTDVEAKPLVTSGALVPDVRRVRPLYFDGRFLAARDLTRDQSYFLARQADLGQLAGPGIAAGLRVETDGTGAKLRIEPGFGVTPSGEVVVLRDTAQPGASPAWIELDAGALSEVPELEAAFGLSQRPRGSARDRTGVFVLALRPVEYTANPVAEYPTSLRDRKLGDLRDGDIVEATAVTIIPFEVDVVVGAERPLAARAAACRAVFGRDRTLAMPVDALPLAMISLQRGALEWVDTWLVRREVGGEPLAGLGLAPRALREAFVLHHQGHLDDIVVQRASAAQSQRFAAGEHFTVLPPAGRLPHGAVYLDGPVLGQGFFPPEVDVELSIVPEDELGPAVDDAIALPPIDLTQPVESLEGVAVTILVPLSRQEIAERNAALVRVDTPIAQAAVAPRLLRARPLLGLRKLERFADRAGIAPPPTSPSTETQAWAEIVNTLASSGRPLWYVRRRSARWQTDMAWALTARVVTPEPPLPAERLEERLELTRDLGLYKQLLETAPEADLRRALEPLLAADSKLLTTIQLMEWFIAAGGIERNATEPPREGFEEERLELQDIEVNPLAETTRKRAVEGAGLLIAAVPDLEERSIRIAIGASGMGLRLLAVATTTPDAAALAKSVMVAAKAGELATLRELARRRRIPQ